MDLERERENPRNDNFRQSRETIDRNTRESRERERETIEGERFALINSRRSPLLAYRRRRHKLPSRR